MLEGPPEDVLVRWIDFLLKAAEQDRVVTNLGKDLKECQALYYVLNKLDKSKCRLTHKDHPDELLAPKNELTTPERLASMRLYQLLTL